MRRHPLSDLDADIRDHIDRLTQEHIDRGMPPDEARYAALRAFGSIARVREDTRAVWIPQALEQAARDVRHALRTMRRQPGFTIAVVLMLAIGLGLVLGVYTVFNGVFVRGWDLPDSSMVFRAYGERRRAPESGIVPDGFSAGGYEHVRAAARTADYVAFKSQTFRVRPTRGDGGYHAMGMLASDNVIETLRIPLQRGTGFGGRPDPNHRRIVISNGLWRGVFGADEGIVGRTAWLTGTPATIVGVAADGFEGLGERRVEVILELSSAGAWLRQNDRATDGTVYVTLAGRIRPGRSQSQVRAELDVLTAAYRRSTGAPALGVTIGSTTPGEQLRRNGRSGAIAVVLTLAGAGAALVMLLTCANVGNLFLARSLRRAGEMAVRLSLGASRARIVAQLLTEGFLLALVSGACALLMTLAAPVLMEVLNDSDFPTSTFAPDWRVAAVAFGAVAAVCLLVSLAPALQATRMGWRAGAAIASPRTRRTRAVVLAAQIAIAAVLVVSATLLARGVAHSVSVPLGFALHETTAITIQMPPTAAYDVNRLNDARDALVRAVGDSGLPVAVAGTVPASDRAGLLVGVSLAQSDVRFRCQLVPLTGRAFGVLGIDLVAGRPASDELGAGEAVINETLARQLWPGESPLGRSLTLSFDRRTYTVTGVARDAHLTSLSEIEPMVHTPHAPGLPVLLVRTNPRLEREVRALIASVDPALDVAFTPLSQTVTQMLRNARAGMTIAATLGAVALVLAVIGVFGVFSYLVEERRREIGVRLALGATRRQIGAALAQATRGAVAGGVATGLVLSVIAALVLRQFLFGLSPADPVSYVLVALLLCGAALAATAVPVRRALAVDPATTLRAE